MSETLVKNRELFEDMPVAKAVSTMAIPTIIGQLIILAYNLADTFFLGRTGNPSMVGGASLILPIYNITLAIGSLMGVGGGSLISRLLGLRNEEEAKRVSSFCMWVGLFSGIAFSLLVFIFMKPLLLLLGASVDNFEYAKEYAMCVLVAGGIPTIMNCVLSNLVRNIGESKKAGLGVTIGGVCNLALDPLFMFVILPSGYEALGAGLATCFSNYISCAYFIITIRKLKRSSVLGIHSISNRPNRSSIIQIFAVGIPSSMAQLLFDVDYIVLDKLMSGYGDVAMAAIGIVLKAERVPLNTGIGICQGMVPIVAYNFASKNHKRMRDVTRFSLLSGVVCAVFCIILYEIFAPSIMRFFIKDAATIALGTKFLRVRSAATVLMFISFFHVHIFNSYGRGKEALALGVIRWAGINIPLLFIFNAIIGINGLVWAQLVGDTLTVIISFIVHRRFTKKVLPTLDQ